MEFGLQTRGSYDDVLTAARWAEARGLACFALPDHYLAGRSPTGDGHDTRSADIYPYLGGLSVETSTLQLAALVSPITYRHPAALLKLGLAIDVLGKQNFAPRRGSIESELQVAGREGVLLSGDHRLGHHV